MQDRPPPSHNSAAGQDNPPPGLTAQDNTSSLPGCPPRYHDCLYHDYVAFVWCPIEQIGTFVCFLRWHMSPIVQIGLFSLFCHGTMRSIEQISLLSVYCLLHPPGALPVLPEIQAFATTGRTCQPPSFSGSIPAAPILEATHRLNTLVHQAGQWSTLAHPSRHLPP